MLGPYLKKRQTLGRHSAGSYVKLSGFKHKLIHVKCDAKIRQKLSQTTKYGNVNKKHSQARIPTVMQDWALTGLQCVFSTM